jgi:hypothetical protein
MGYPPHSKYGNDEPEPCVRLHHSAAG